MNDSDHFVRYPLSARFTHARGRRAADAVHVRALGGTSDWRRRVLDRVGVAAVADCGNPPLAIGSGMVVAGLPPDCPRRGAAGPSARPGDPRRCSGHARSVGSDSRSLPADGGTRLVLKLGRPDEGIETEAAGAAPSLRRPVAGDRHAASARRRRPRPGGSGRLPSRPSRSGCDGNGRPSTNRCARSRPTWPSDCSRCARPVGTPSRAVPTHGDLTPWNLRRTGRGLALFDWEAAGWRARRAPTSPSTARTSAETQSTTTVDGVLNDMLPAASNACACR